MGGLSEPSLRVELGRVAYKNALLRSRGFNLTHKFQADDEDKVYVGAGTPPSPGPSFDIRQESFWSTSTLVEHEQPQPVAVHTSPVKALAQICSAFDGTEADQDAVARLALHMVKVVELKHRMKGYSAICVAAACVLAAERALGKAVMLIETASQVGIECVQAPATAYRDLQHQSIKSGAMHTAVKLHGGDVSIFPGKTSPKKTHRRGYKMSLLEKLRADAAARGSSPLKKVENASATPPLPETTENDP